MSFTSFSNKKTIMNRTLFIFICTMLIAYAAAQFGGFGGGRLPQVPTSVKNVANAIPGLTNVKNFGEFLSATGKKYATQAEQQLREGLFAARKNAVDKQNELFKAGKSTFEMGINQFADLKIDEIIGKLTGRKKNSQGEQKATKHKVKSAPPASVAVPNSIDWRKKGGVTPVKFQGLECGACWSFATTGAIEGHLFRKTGKLENLSEQHLVDCADAYGNEGCDGGYQEYAFAFVTDNKGIAKASAYPYKEKKDECAYSEAIKGGQIQGFATIEPGDEAAMKKVVGTLGPLACSVNAAPDSFVLYKSGIYKDEACNAEEVNHAILVVGYGTENGQDYWIIKNSWTEKWGEGGFMKLPRNSNSFCGVAAECSYPVV